MKLRICCSARGPYATPAGSDRFISRDDGATYANDMEAFHPPGTRGRHRTRNTSGDRGPSRDSRGGFVPVGDRSSPARRSSLDVGRRPDEDSGLWNGRFAVCQQDSGISILDSPPMERHPERLMRGGNRGGHLETCEKFSGRHSKGSSSSQRGVVAPIDIGQQGLMEAHNSMRHLEPRTSTSSSFPGSRQQMMDPVRTDSVNSDPSDCSGRPHKSHHARRTNRHKRHSSASSSDDGTQTTPEGTSCDEVEIESESISEKGQSQSCRVQLILLCTKSRSLMY